MPLLGGKGILSRFQTLLSMTMTDSFFKKKEISKILYIHMTPRTGNLRKIEDSI